MRRPSPADTKLLICVWHKFTLWRPPSDLGARIQARWPDMRVVQLAEYVGIEQELPDTDILVGFSLRPEQFARAHKLKWIHSTAAGVGQLMFPGLRRSGVLLSNAGGVHVVPMAEHVLGTLIALARRFPDAVRFQRHAHWAQQELWDASPPVRDLRGQVLLLVGLGRVGREIARLVRPLGMQIHAITRSGAGDAQLAQRIMPASQLEAALPTADFVVLAAPETEETRHLIGVEQLRQMKPTAYLINVARGTLLDEAALAQALKSHRIAGAALDVTATEPLPPDSPLWKLDNVFITPHISAVGDTLWPNQIELLLDNLERWFSGRELRNQVDFAKGY